jgi:hypothetical protein
MSQAMSKRDAQFRRNRKNFSSMPGETTSATSKLQVRTTAKAHFSWQFESVLGTLGLGNDVRRGRDLDSRCCRRRNVELGEYAATGVERASEMLFSAPYLDETLAFVVRDHLREQSISWASIRDLGPFSLAIVNLPYYVDEVKIRAPALKLELVKTPEGIEDGLKKETLDAAVLSAERGSVLTLLYPKYTVVVPEPGIVKVPLPIPWPDAIKSGGNSSIPGSNSNEETVRSTRFIPLDSGRPRLQAPAVLVGHPQCAPLGGVKG